ncbi:MAG: hypothetical protein HGB12_14960 [Bacteroidetes bacterium]|nr:hypothetical protein [Bacteroidota bacterium]
MKTYFFLFAICFSNYSFAQDIFISQLKNQNDTMCLNGIPYTGAAFIIKNGIKTVETNYKNGFINGVHILRNEKGNITSSAEFINNKYNGKVVYYYDNEQKKSEEIYVNDYRNGMAVYWYENGQKESEGNYFDCSNDGKWIYWDKDGKKIKEQIYDKGKLLKETKF